MGELRKDYFLERWVVFSTGRGKRPRQFAEQPVQSEVSQCFFCPNNESLTPPEIGRRGDAKKWFMRWFENKFPALVQDGSAVIKTDNRFYTFSSNFGYHEVVVETSEHSKQLSDLSVREISELFSVFKDRIRDLSSKENVAYVSVIKNHGPSAGTSIVHSHSQIFAASIIPSLVMEKVLAVRKFVGCPYCDIIGSEKDSARRCFENDEWIAFAPYASRFNYEVWLFPKEHVKTLAELSSFDSLADVLKKVLVRLKELGCSYNFCLTYAPAGHDLHLHLEVLPRIAVWGGLEVGTNCVINSVMPEDAAIFYRGDADG
ncbi:galactose-1-phosphate uridylyltransferase [Candidatus Woesearchaeota archaeon]|nr:galactose-1-phosphate uridylyltransferase [Candidatus Woesearchaeota archaeon]